MPPVLNNLQSAWVKTDMGPPQPPPPQHQGHLHPLYHQPQAHGQHQPAHVSHGQLVWNNRENRRVH